MANLVKVGGLFLLTLLVACSSLRVFPGEPKVGGAAVPASWEFARDAIHLNLVGDSRLNLYQGAPHTLLVCLYQLSDPNPFFRKAESRDGLTELLRCESFDRTVTSSRRIILQPGEKFSIGLDRTEGTRDLAVVAGYYSMAKEQMVRHYPIPVEVDNRSSTARPVKMNLNLKLGPQQIDADP